MVLTEVVTPQVALPVVGVVLGAVLVFAFGFKSPAQPPSFEALELEDGKKPTKKGKQKKKSPTNGHIPSAVAEANNVIPKTSGQIRQQGIATKTKSKKYNSPKLNTKPSDVIDNLENDDGGWTTISNTKNKKIKNRKEELDNSLLKEASTLKDQEKPVKIQEKFGKAGKSDKTADKPSSLSSVKLAPKSNAKTDVEESQEVDADQFKEIAPPQEQRKKERGSTRSRKTSQESAGAVTDGSSGPDVSISVHEKLAETGDETSAVIPIEQTSKKKADPVVKRKGKHVAAAPEKATEVKPVELSPAGDAPPTVQSSGKRGKKVSSKSSQDASSKSEESKSSSRSDNPSKDDQEVKSPGKKKNKKQAGPADIVSPKTGPDADAGTSDDAGSSVLSATAKNQTTQSSSSSVSNKVQQSTSRDSMPVLAASASAPAPDPTEKTSMSADGAPAEKPVTFDEIGDWQEAKTSLKKRKKARREN